MGHSRFAKGRNTLLRQLKDVTAEWNESGSDCPNEPQVISRLL